MTVEADAAAGFRTGMTDSLLREIAHHLGVLAKTGACAAIDLCSLPLTAADRSELEARLGHGDLEAVLTAAGTSEIWETRYAGVWWVRHLGARDKLAAERIEITASPEILTSHAADIAAASNRLAEDLIDRVSSEDAEDA
ncbi:hydrogenase expression/formation C-terminal domain-containing protein [Bradyrhizobium oligotrophicum]|uniref:hydrogenase expression/formation C-terminal domain-containing protein n=1 Tax=Bradyrhizobium oligotrophicum TaxID=44255 RepID=UPI003EBB42CD